MKERTEVIEHGDLELPQTINEDISFWLMTGWTSVRGCRDKRHSAKVFTDHITTMPKTRNFVK
tara:strand:+ start:3717 stop:3905 length:189 start_codon:yes stop_codon:yes gene_type:complete